MAIITSGSAAGRRNAGTLRRALATVTAAVLCVSLSLPAYAQGRVAVVRDAEIETLLKDYATPVLKAAGLKSSRVQIVLVNDTSFNAFVDGERIFINTGALSASSVPNEIIGVIAHEAGHLAGGHQQRLREQIATAQTLAERINAGGYVVIAADRFPLSGQRTQTLDFLGGQARFPEGPFRLATLLRCPLYALACVRDGAHFRIDFECLGDTQELPRRQRETWIADAMQNHANHLAERVRRHPLQWFNFYPFWNNDTGYLHDDTP